MSLPSPVLLAQNVRHLLGCFHTTAIQPHFDDGVDAVAEKLNVIADMLVVKILLRPLRIVDEYLMGVVIPQLKIGFIKQA